MYLRIFSRVYTSIFRTNPGYQLIPIHNIEEEWCLSTQIECCSYIEHIPLKHAESKQILAGAINCISDQNQNQYLLLVLQQTHKDLQKILLDI